MAADHTELSEVALESDPGKAAHALAACASDQGLHEPLQEAIAVLSRRGPSFTSAFTKVAVDNFRSAAGGASCPAGSSGCSQWAVLLRFIGAECPAALDADAGALCAWLAGYLASGAAEGDDTQRAAVWICQALEHCIPAWSRLRGRCPPAAEDPDPGLCGAPDLRGRLAEFLERVPTFNVLLDKGRLWLTRGAARCLCSLVTHADGDAGELLVRARRTMDFLVDLTTKQRTFDIPCQAMICHEMWVLATILEYAQVDLPAATEADGRGAPDAVSAKDTNTLATLLGTLCSSGPPALRPALAPCIGFLLRGNGQILYAHGCLHEALRSGLLTESRALRARTLETMSWVFSEEEAQRCSGRHSSITSTMACDVVQRLAQFQTDIFRAVGETTNPAVIASILTIVRALRKLGALDGPLAMTKLLVLCLVGKHQNRNLARRAFLELAADGPQVVLDSLPRGLQEAASCLARQAGDEFEAPLLETLQEAWRFAPVHEACADEADVPCDDRILVQILEMVQGLAIEQHPPPPSEVQVWIAGLLFGLLRELPCHAHSSLECVSQTAIDFHTRVILPMVQSHASGSSTQWPQRHSVLGACLGSAILTCACQQHQLPLPYAAPPCGAGCPDGADGPMLGFVSLLNDLGAAALSGSAPLPLLTQRLAITSPPADVPGRAAEGRRPGAGAGPGAAQCRGAPDADPAEPCDRSSCLARTCLGGQCRRKAVQDSEFCRFHHNDERWRLHGRIDGPAPAAKLRQSLRGKSGAGAVPELAGRQSTDSESCDTATAGSQASERKRPRSVSAEGCGDQEPDSPRRFDPQRVMAQACHAGG